MLACLILVALFRSGFLMGPPYGDEKHYFSNALKLIPFHIQRLRNFPEATTPTLHVAFSFLLRILGPNILWCRLIVFGCLIGCVLVYRGTASEVAHRLRVKPEIASLSWILLVTFPYFTSIGVYYYTDIPALLFVLLAYRAYLQGRIPKAVLWSTFALHCRQYTVFLPVAAMGFEVWRAWRHRDGKAMARTTLWIVPLISFLPYLVLWGGPFPARFNDPRLVDLPRVMPWHVTFLLSACGLYLVPVALFLGWRRWNWKKLGCVASGLLFFALFVPRPNVYFELIDSPITTLGLLDGTLVRVGGRSMEMILLAIGMILAMVLHYEILARSGDGGTTPLKWMVVAFWIMNLFSYLTWEKYLLLVLPLLYLSALGHPYVRSSGQGH